MSIKCIFQLTFPNFWFWKISNLQGKPSIRFTSHWHSAKFSSCMNLYANAYAYIHKIHKYIHLNVFWTWWKMSLYFLRTMDIVLPQYNYPLWNFNIDKTLSSNSPYLDNLSCPKKIFEKFSSMRDPTKGLELHLVFTNVEQRPRLFFFFLCFSNSVSVYLFFQESILVVLQVIPLFVFVWLLPSLSLGLGKYFWQEYYTDDAVFSSVGVLGVNTIV